MVLSEPGVLPPSERYFSTPSDLARRLFYYVSICGHYFCDEAYAFSSHSPHGQEEIRKTYLLFYLVAGRLQFSLEGASFTATAGEVVLLDCRRAHDYRSLGRSEFLWIHLDGANSRQFYDEILASKRQRPAFLVPNGDDIRRGMGRVLDSFRLDRGLASSERSQTLYRLLCHLLLVPVDPYAGEDESPLGVVVRAIDRSLAHAWTLPDLAALAAMSTSRFSRYFKERTGESPHQFILLKRIDRAKYLLNSTTLSVKQIAFEVGFHSESRFVTAFLAKAGASPQTYRKNPYAGS